MFSIMLLYFFLIKCKERGSKSRSNVLPSTLLQEEAVIYVSSSPTNSAILAYPPLTFSRPHPRLHGQVFTSLSRSHDARGLQI